MTPEQLAEIKARCEAATPGPWIAGHDGSERLRNVCHMVHAGERLVIYGQANAAEVAFIAHAREDIPALLAEVERLQAENATLWEDRTREIEAQAARETR